MQSVSILLPLSSANKAHMQTLVWTLVGSLCSSSASLVCCPGLDLPGLRHPHLPEGHKEETETKQKNPSELSEENMVTL